MLPKFLKPSNPSSGSSPARPEGKLHRSPASADDGYESERDDPPQSFFEGMMRDRERETQKDPSLRRRDRKLMQSGWKLEQHMDSPAFFVRGAGVYQQKEGTCQTLCAIMFLLRDFGVKSNQEALDYIRNSDIARRLSTWQEMYAEGGWDQGIATSEANALNDVAYDLRRVVLDMGIRLPENTASEISAIVGGTGRAPAYFFQLIGRHPRDVPVFSAMKDGFRTKLTLDGTTVENSPHMPAGSDASFQQSLFQNFQQPVERRLSLPGALLPRMTRSATPFVMLKIYLRTHDGSLGSHAVLVDFSDRGAPQIFDPNFGLMGGLHGFNALSFEQALYALWAFYTRTPSREKGRAAANVVTVEAEARNQLFVVSSQLYKQSGSVPAARAPEKSKL